jgi:4a-hydroxytetrahydrobiopterin dehydratase
MEQQQQEQSTTEATTTADKRCPTCGCVGKNPQSLALSDEEVLAAFSTLKASSLWKLSEDRKTLSRKFMTRNWQAAINAINLISAIAEREDIQHHPDLHLTAYRNVEIVLYTHVTDGLTELDFKLANEVDQFEFEYSPKWLRENQISI